MKNTKLVMILALVALFAVTANAQIVVTEIMQNPSAVSDSDGEYFEIYNDGALAYNLNSWTFEDADFDSFMVVGDLVIDPGEYLVFGVNGDPALNGGVTVDYVYTDMFLSNSSDELMVYNDSGTLVDEVWYDGGTEWPDPNGASMQLVDIALDNNVGANWMEANTPYGDGDFGTPGEENYWIAEIVITEIMQNPAAVSDGDGEYFEIYNNGASTFNLNGWTFEDAGADSFMVAGDLLIDPGQYLVFGVNGDPSLNGGVTVDYVYTGMFLSNSDDELIIYDDLGNMIDEAWYDGGATWPDPTGASMQLIDVTLDNNVGANWMEANTPYGDGDLGTPGAENYWALQVVITEIMQNPSAVLDGDGEYFEIYNMGTTTYNLNGWYFTDAGVDSFMVMGDLFLDPGAYMVFAINGDSLTNGGFNADYVYTGMNLSNSDDEIFLYDDTGALVDEVWYDGGTVWPDPTGASMQLTDVMQDNNDGANWLAADTPFGAGDFGTPGEENTWGGGGPIAVTVADIQTDTLGTYLGQEVIFTGIVTQGHNTIHDTYVDVYVQDDSGYGIMLYASDPVLGVGLDRGDEVEVIGTVDQYFSTTEIINFTFTELTTGNALPAPMTFTTGEFATALDFEGVWTELTGTITTAPGTPDQTYNFTIDDGTGDATIRMYALAAIDLTAFEVGDEITVRGTMDSFNNVAQLQPSDPADVDAPPAGPAELTLTPTVTEVPAIGGNVYYNAHLVSNLPGTFPGIYYQTYVYLPGGNLYGPITTQYFTLQPYMDITVNDVTLSVPGFAPSGTYTFEGRVGANPNLYIFDQFEFTKLAAAGAYNGGVSDWAHSEIAFEEASGVVSLPTEYGMGSAYPNPFNPSTTVEVRLPEAAELTVSVYNVMGQQVATLAQGMLNAGAHTVTFDASNMSSGIYFIKAEVPGQLNELRKVTLMK